MDETRNVKKIFVSQTGGQDFENNKEAETNRRG
jgi:hypothetical protein